jgi:tRNA threonylcarbamoyladenosine biosynthesis protein TsaE
MRSGDTPEAFLSTGEAQTLAWAQAFAERLQPGDTVSLSGNLGAGKTVVCRGIALGLGFSGDVHSPSYALVHEYAGARLPLFHMDLYRLKEGADWEEIGLDHYFHAGGVCLVEWPERLPSSRPFTWRISLLSEGGDDHRANGDLRGNEARRIRVSRG